MQPEQPATNDPTMIRAGNVFARHWEHRYLVKEGTEQRARHIAAVLLLGPTSAQGAMTLERLREHGLDPRMLARALTYDNANLARDLP